MAAFFPFFLLSTNLMVEFSHREVMILARVLFFSSRSYLGLCLTGMVSELLLVSKEDRDPLGKARKVIRYQRLTLDAPQPLFLLLLCNYERNFLDSNATYPFGVDVTNYASLPMKPTEILSEY